jgi:diguanylate cyclase (GGDEF)-like protein
MIERRQHPIVRAIIPAVSVYALVIPLAFALLGPPIGIIPTASILIAAWLLGMRAALITAALAVIANTLLNVSSGDELDVAIRASSLAAGFFLAIGMLIARIRADKARVERLTMFDRLTDLPRRDVFDERVDRMLRARVRAQVALIDVVGFRILNKSFGHDVANQVIREFARRIGANFKDDLVARLGTDVFGVLAPVTGTDEVFAARALEAFRAPFLIGGSLLTVEGHVGVARSPEHGETSAMLRGAAESAASSIRHPGLAWAAASQTHSRDSSERLLILGDLRQALDRDELRLHYQPLVDVTSGNVVGFEALMRWQRNGELVPPAHFIPLAEQTGLIIPLTDWVVGEALRQSAEWARVGHPVRISINVGAKAIGASSHLEAVIEKAAAEHGVPASQLTVEITETDVMTDPVQATRTLAGLKRLGVRVAVDDFGTGYSSLSYLNELPLDEVKIDRSFISRLLREPQTSVIVRAAVDLSHALGLDAVAEGVEDLETLERLTLLGCDRAQGYFFARPMPADTVLSWLQRYVPTPSVIPAPLVALAPVAVRPKRASTVLVVDDEPSLGVATNRILSGQGFNVLTAATGTEALRICAEQAIDLVVADIFLTDWRGHELAGRVRKLHPAMKFLFVSGDPTASDLVKDAPFLAKPFSQQQLIASVDSVLLGAA